MIIILSRKLAVGVLTKPSPLLCYLIVLSYGLLSGPFIWPCVLCGCGECAIVESDLHSVMSCVLGTP